MKNNRLSDDVDDILKKVNAVKKTMRNKKYCFTTCDNETIKKVFVTTLKMDLINLYYSLDNWMEADMPMLPVNEGDFNADSYI